MYVFVYPKSLKVTFKPGFLVQKNLVNLCVRDVNSQGLLYSRKNRF